MAHIINHPFDSDDLEPSPEERWNLGILRDGDINSLISRGLVIAKHTSNRTYYMLTKAGIAHGLKDYGGTP